MNWKKFLIAFVVTFVFMFGFGFVWYGKLMHGAHMEVPALWRTEAEFGNYFSWLILGHVVMAFFMTMLYARHGGGSVARRLTRDCALRLGAQTRGWMRVQTRGGSLGSVS